uniref:ABC transporter permease subunit n=1 Tax=uncultured Methylobacterium sp. TaxID=157278 RepID=UPI00259833D7
MTDRSERYTLPFMAVALVALPFCLSALGLTLTSATDVVVFAVACMGLNILVGQTGLVSFGHGAFFGLGAYAAAIGQRTFFPGTLLPPILFALAFVSVAAVLLGLLILRRRGVYFSLLTLALSALSFTVAFRWTALTGGESGYGGVERTRFLGLDLDAAWTWYGLVAVTAFAVVVGLARFRRSPVGTVLEAIRENEQRARFLGYPTNRYKLVAFTVSATVTGLAGILSVFTHRFASAEPLGSAFSGELLAMVVIGGMRSFAGPAIGALFFILFREMLSIWTANWLFWFGLLFVGFILFSPDGLVGIGRRLSRMVRPPATEDAAMAGRRAGLPENLPQFLRPDGIVDGVILAARGIAKRFGGLKAVDDVTIAVCDRTLHALIGPNGAGKTTAFNLISGMYRPDSGTVTLGQTSIAGFAPERICEAGIGRSFQITNLFPALTVEDNIRLAVQGRRPGRFDPWRDARADREAAAETAEILRWLGLAGLERAEAGSLSYGGQRLLDMGV